MAFLFLARMPVTWRRRKAGIARRAMPLGRARRGRGGRDGGLGDACQKPLMNWALDHREDIAAARHRYDTRPPTPLKGTSP